MKEQCSNTRLPKTISALMILFSFIVLEAQEPAVIWKPDKVEFEHIGERNGIGKYIESVYQDSRGFIWFGSWGYGLYRFDGSGSENFVYDLKDPATQDLNGDIIFKFEDSPGNIWFLADNILHRYNRATNNFTRFLHDPADPGTIPDGKISSVIEDLQGNIWIGTYRSKKTGTVGCLSRYNSVSGKFVHYKFRQEGPDTLLSEGITCLYLDHTGELWAGTASGEILRVHADSAVTGGDFIHYTHESNDPESLLRSGVSDIKEDKSGSLWFATYGGGLIKYDRREDKILRYWVHPDKSSAMNEIKILSPDPEGGLWLGTMGGLAFYDREKDTFVIYQHDPADPFSLTPGPVTAIAHNNKSMTWILTSHTWNSNGLNMLDRATGKLSGYKSDPQDPSGLSTNYINTLFVDNTGILWVGTTDGGIDKFDPKKWKFGIKRFGPNSSSGINSDRIYPITEDHNGMLWIGTHGNGLYRFDRNSGAVTNYMYDSNKIDTNLIQAICEGPPGTLWLGGLGGLKKLDLKTMKVRHFIINPDDPDAFIGPDHSLFIRRVRSGILWIGTWGAGLQLFDPKTEKFEHCDKFSDKQEGLTSNYITYIYEDHEGTVWLASFDKGLFRYIPGEKGRPLQFKNYNKDRLNGLSSDMVRCIVEDRAGNLWLGTEEGGLNKFDKKKETSTFYTVEDGLASNTIYGILVDEKDNLWISTAWGLSKFDPVNEKFVNYDLSDGLQGMWFNFNAFCKSRTGEMFFGGGMGMNYFYPDSVKENPFVPPVVITGFKLFNKSVPIGKDSPLKKAISETRKLKLRYNENFPSFEFAALNYTSSHKNRYKYRMIGLDPDTIYAGTQRRVDYTDMKPGKYTFWVTGSNNDGVWNKKGVSLDIIISPPWYHTGLAYAGYGILFVLMVLGFIRWRTWRLIRDKEALEKQVKERTRDIEERDRHILETDRRKTRFFANISHEFRTPLTLILSQMDDMMSAGNTTDQEHRKLSAVRRSGLRLLDLVNQLLDLSKMDSGKLKLELTEEDIFKVIRRIFSSFLSLADKKKIQYDFKVPEGELITWFDKDKLETIINNLLSNAFKYTPDNGKIECKVRMKETAGETNGSPSVIEISVKDNGSGISQQNVTRIFDRFYQADEQYHIQGGGSGIGLAVTKELILLLHGEINVESEPGKGSCFTVTFPLGKEHLKDTEYKLVKPETTPMPEFAEEMTGEDEGSDREAARPVPDKKPVQILIVEDNPDLRTYIKEMFQKDYTVEEAADGEEGLKKAIHSIPDLIITDVMMPVMDGIGLCDRIKTNEKTSHIPVIMLTAKADVESRIKGLKTGADDYLVKPFNKNELIVRVKNLLEQRNRLRKRYADQLAGSKEELTINSYDMNFMNRTIETIEDHLTDFDFGVKDLQAKANMSRTQLYRKIMALTGLSPSRLIRKLRLMKAVRLMEEGKENITEIAFDTGFNNLSWFNKCFKEQYGISPSEYKKKY